MPAGEMPGCRIVELSARRARAVSAWKLEAAVRHVFELADRDPATPFGMGDLARQLFGWPVIVQVPDDQRADVALSMTDDGAVTIRIRGRLTPPAFARGVAIAIARWYFRAYPAKCAGGTVESLALGLLMPAPAIRRALATRKLTMGGLAFAFVVDEETAARRHRQIFGPLTAR